MGDVAVDAVDAEVEHVLGEIQAMKRAGLTVPRAFARTEADSGNVDGADRSDAYKAKRAEAARKLEHRARNPLLFESLRDQRYSLRSAVDAAHVGDAYRAMKLLGEADERLTSARKAAQHDPDYAADLDQGLERQRAVDRRFRELFSARNDVDELRELLGNKVGE